MALKTFDGTCCLRYLKIIFQIRQLKICTECGTLIYTDSVQYLQMYNGANTLLPLLRGYCFCLLGGVGDMQLSFMPPEQCLAMECWRHLKIYRKF